MPRAGKSIDWTGATNSPTWSTGTATSIFGSLTLISGMTVSSTAAYTFEGRGAYTLTNAGNEWTKHITITAPGGTYTLQDALSTANTWSFAVTAGTFDANDFNVTIGLFNSTGTGTRSVIMGSGTWELTANNTPWNTLTTTNLTLTPETSTIKLTGTLTTTRHFFSGGLTFNNYWNATTGAFPIHMYGSNIFNDFRIDAGRTQQFIAGTTTTVNTFTATGTSGNEITITSATAANHNLAKAGGGTISSDYLIISRSQASPGTTWYAGANSTDGGNNTGWIFAALDATAPVFSSVTPTSTSSINNVTSSSDIAFTTDEALASGSITITRTSGTADGNSPHTCTLTGTALNVGAHTIDLSDTTNGCTSDVSNLVSGTIYTLVFAGTDGAGNVATAITRTDVTFDNTAPTIVSVSSDKSNGSYTVGEIIDIDVTFSEAVTSTGNVNVTLETGDTDQTCTFSVSSSTTGTCNYTVQAGDTSADLNATISGTIADLAGNSLTNFVPATTLATSKDIVIDTTAPTPGTLTSTATTTSSITIEISGASDAVGLSATPYNFRNITTDTYSGATSSTSTEFTGLTSGTSYSFEATITDTAGNTSTTPTISVSTVAVNSNNSGSVARSQRSTAPTIQEITVPPTPTPNTTSRFFQPRSIVIPPENIIIEPNLKEEVKEVSEEEPVEITKPDTIIVPPAPFVPKEPSIFSKSGLFIHDTYTNTKVNVSLFFTYAGETIDSTYIATKAFFVSFRNSLSINIVKTINNFKTLADRYDKWKKQFAVEKKIEDLDPRLPVELVDHRYETITIRLSTAEGRPMQGAELTLLSEPKEATTDETGAAIFTDVETGEHTLMIAFGEFRGSQKLFLNQDVPDLSVFVVPQLQEGISPGWTVVAFLIGVMGTILVAKKVHLRFSQR